MLYITQFLFFLRKVSFVTSRHILWMKTIHYPNTIRSHLVLYCTVLYCTVLYCTALHCTALHCTALHCTALHCTALHCTALHCAALHWRHLSPTLFNAYINELESRMDAIEGMGVNINRGMKAICQQASKSQTVIEVHVLKHPTVSLNHIFQLFDILIKPILTYGCAVWGTGNYTDI